MNDINNVVSIATLRLLDRLDELTQETTIILQLFLDVFSGEFPTFVGYLIVETFASMCCTFRARNAFATL